MKVSGAILEVCPPHMEGWLWVYSPMGGLSFAPQCGGGKGPGRGSSFAEKWPLQHLHQHCLGELPEVRGHPLGIGGSSL